MSESAMSASQASKGRPRKSLHIALWAVQVLLALAFVGSSSGKLLGKAEAVTLFETIGIGQWFRYVTGILELGAAVLIVIPMTRVAGAAPLVGIMTGAIVTHLLVLHNAPTAALVLLVLAGFVIWGRRGDVTPVIGK